LNITKRLKEVKRILSLIRARKFKNLPEIKEPTNEFEAFKKALLELAKEFQIYINLLTQEAEYFKIKAYRDVLTGALNRNFLEEKGNEILIKYKLKSQPLGVIMLDIDNFKRVNDTCGHDIGDLVLKTVANTIKKSLRKDDLIIRYGGEEFLILLPNTDLEQTLKVTEKIRRNIENTEITIPTGEKIKVTASLGVSVVYPEDKNIFVAIKRADEKLHHAKQKGKNRVEV
jgi:two-component system cell cycle response regulator